MLQERIASGDQASPKSLLHGDEADAEAGMPFSILHFLLGGSLLRPAQLQELETVKSQADLSPTHAL